MADNSEPLSPEKPIALLVHGYVKAKAAKPRSMYRAMRIISTRTGHGISIAAQYKNAKVCAIKQTRTYHYAEAAGILTAAEHLAKYNPLTLYAKFLRSRSPKTSAYLLAYDNLIGLRPFYVLYFGYLIYSELNANPPHMNNAVAISIATIKFNIGTTLAQFVRIPMRTLDAACLLPNIIGIDPDKIDRKKRSDRLFAWSIRQANKILPMRVTEKITYRNRIGIHLSIFTKTARRVIRKRAANLPKPSL